MIEDHYDRRAVLDEQLEFGAPVGEVSVTQDPAKILHYSIINDAREHLFVGELHSR